MSGHQPEIYKINCIFEGQPSPFPIQIGKDMSVGMLKKAIKEDNSNALTGVDAVQLTLYRADIKDDDELEKKMQKIMSGDSKPLRSTMGLAKVYSEPPQDEMVHILVRLPLPSGAQPFDMAALYEFADSHASIISGGPSRSPIEIPASGSGNLFDWCLRLYHVC
jgi:hypothetical protein